MRGSTLSHLSHYMYNVNSGQKRYKMIRTEGYRFCLVLYCKTIERTVIMKQHNTYHSQYHSQYHSHNYPPYTIHSAVIDTIEITILYLITIFVLYKILCYMDKTLHRSRRFVDAYCNEIQQLRNETNSEEEKEDSSSESCSESSSDSELFFDHDVCSEYGSEIGSDEDAESKTNEEDIDIDTMDTIVKTFFEKTFLPFSLDNYDSSKQKETEDEDEEEEEEEEEQRNIRRLLTEYIQRTFVSENCIQRLCEISDGMENKMKDQLLQINQINQKIRHLEESIYGSVQESSPSSLSIDSIGKPENQDESDTNTNENTNENIETTENAMTVDWDTVEKPCEYIQMDEVMNE